jgi:hypothetical protein
MPPDSDNPEGFWESEPIYEFHERLLATIGTGWDSFVAVRDEELTEQLKADAEDEGLRIVRTEFGGAPQFVLKDPRICRLVPLWLRILQREAVQPLAILVHRHPAEVADSLRVRNGFDTEQSLLIWLRHVLDAELRTRTVRRVLVEYQDVLDDWQSVARRVLTQAETPLPLLRPEQVADIDRFLDPELRHHRADQKVPNVPGLLAEWIERTWAAIEILHAQDAAGESEALTTLDQIRTEFNKTSAIFERIAEPPAVVRRLRDLEHERAVLHDRLVELERAHATLHEYAANLETSRAELRSALDARAQEAARLHEELSGARELQKALVDSISWKITGPLRAAGRIFR